MPFASAVIKAARIMAGTASSALISESFLAACSRSAGSPYSNWYKYHDFSSRPLDANPAAMRTAPPSTAVKIAMTLPLRFNLPPLDFLQRLGGGQRPTARPHTLWFAEAHGDFAARVDRSPVVHGFGAFWHPDEAIADVPGAEPVPGQHDQPGDGLDAWAAGERKVPVFIL